MKTLDALIDAESKVNALETGITFPKRFFRRLMKNTHLSRASRDYPHPHPVR
jgi:hypothetical protein